MGKIGLKSIFKICVSLRLNALHAYNSQQEFKHFHDCFAFRLIGDIAVGKVYLRSKFVNDAIKLMHLLFCKGDKWPVLPSAV